MSGQTLFRVVLVIAGDKDAARDACFEHSVIVDSMSAGARNTDTIVTGSIAPDELETWRTKSFIRGQLGLPAQPGDLSWYNYRKAATA